MKDLAADLIIDKVIEVACKGNFDKASIAFIFRNRTFKCTRLNGNYQLERIKTDSLNVIHDVLSNDGFKHFINDSLIITSDSQSSKIGDGVNSVHYFIQLPYGLNTPAVHKKLLGTDAIMEVEYFEIEVTFSEEGGGIDFEDRFVYWIHKENYTVDYLAYQYATNGGGIRFREAYNVRVIEGIRFVDYNNFKPKSKKVMLENLDTLFEKGDLKLISKMKI